MKCNLLPVKKKVMFCSQAVLHSAYRSKEVIAQLTIFLIKKNVFKNKICCAIAGISISLPVWFRKITVMRWMNVRIEIWTSKPHSRYWNMAKFDLMLGKFCLGMMKFYF